MNKKLLIGLGIAAVATTLIAIGVLHELKSLRALTINTDDLDEELGEGGEAKDNE